MYRCRERHLPGNALFSAAPRVELGARARPLFCGVSPTTSTSPSLSWPSSLPKENHLYRLPRSARCRARHEDQGAILTRVADPRGRLRVWAAAESAVRADEAADGSGGGN